MPSMYRTYYVKFLNSDNWDFFPPFFHSVTAFSSPDSLYSPPNALYTPQDSNLWDLSTPSKVETDYDVDHYFKRELDLEVFEGKHAVTDDVWATRSWTISNNNVFQMELIAWFDRHLPLSLTPNPSVALVIFKGTIAGYPNTSVYAWTPGTISGLPPYSIITFP